VENKNKFTTRHKTQERKVLVKSERERHTTHTKTEIGLIFWFFSFPAPFSALTHVSYIFSRWDRNINDDKRAPFAPFTVCLSLFLSSAAESEMAGVIF
jgi:hypothetical protein